MGSMDLRTFLTLEVELFGQQAGGILYCAMLFKTESVGHQVPVHTLPT